MTYMASKTIYTQSYLSFLVASSCNSSPSDYTKVHQCMQNWFEHMHIASWKWHLKCMNTNWFMLLHLSAYTGYLTSGIYNTILGQYGTSSRRYAQHHLSVPVLTYTYFAIMLPLM